MVPDLCSCAIAACRLKGMICDAGVCLSTLQVQVPELGVRKTGRDGGRSQTGNSSAGVTEMVGGGARMNGLSDSGEGAVLAFQGLNLLGQHDWLITTLKETSS